MRRLKTATLKNGYRGLVVKDIDEIHQRVSYRSEVILPRPLMNQYQAYLETLLVNPRIKGQERQELEQVAQQLRQGNPVVYGTSEGDFRFFSFMVCKKRRSIEGLGGYSKRTIYKIK